MSSLYRAFALFGILLASCDSSNRAPIETSDAGTVLTCSSTEDCQGTGICVAGLCQSASSCTSDEDCSGDGKVCHEQRFFCVECDGRPGQCGDNRTCQFDFTCVDVSTSQTDAGVSDGGSECSGSCSTRAECAPDRVCRDSTCCPPPPRCTSPDDCPESAPQCNGATGQCFGGAGCFQDLDCETEPGCAGNACFCEIVGAPPGTCRVRPDECANDMDCWVGGTYSGKYCALNARPRTCNDAPMCSSDADCAALGLVCDTTPGSPSEGYCVNGQPCPMGTECGPGQVCVNGVCVGANCLNQPSLCQPTEMCDPNTGQCVPVQSGACTQDTDCPQGQFCNRAINPPQCQPGCRSNADCPGGVCNAMNQCEYPNNAICGPCMMDSDCPAGTQCVSFAGSSLCREPCLTSQTCTDTNRQCVLLYCSCFL